MRTNSRSLSRNRDPQLTAAITGLRRKALWLAAVCLSFALSTRAAETQPDRERFNQPTGPSSALLKDLRIEVHAYDRTIVMDLSEYAENTAARLHTLLGYAPAEQPAISLHANDAGTNTPHIVTGQLSGGGLFMKIEGGDMPSLEEMDEAFCRIYLTRYAIEQEVVARRASTNFVPLPDWFIGGIACNLHGARRAEMIDTVLLRWQKGHDTSLLHFLENPGEPDRLYMSTFFITWLSCQPDKAGTFRAVLARIGEDPSSLSAAYVATLIPGCTDAADLAEEWERWILKNRRAVRTPGETSSTALAQFKAQLLFMRGHGGIPLGTNGFETMGFADIIREKHADWVPDFARSKIPALHLLQVGQGQPFADAVTAYTEFFDALASRRADRLLYRLLATARTSMARLERSVSPTGDAPALPTSPEDGL